MLHLLLLSLLRMRFRVPQPYLRLQRPVRRPVFVGSVHIDTF